MQYKIGDYVSKPITGVCKIADILQVDMRGVKNDQLYYLLLPVNDEKEKIYVPVRTSDMNLRPCLTKEEAWNLIERIPYIQSVWIENEKMREHKYKEIIRTNDPEALVSIIKMIYQRKRLRMQQGKKGTSSDEKYFQMAENLLYSEMGVALGKQKQEICQVISDFFKTKGA